MNAMIAQARGDIIVRMDVHCEYAPDYVRQCVESLERDRRRQRRRRAARRGRRPWFQRALCAALDSPLGVGGAKYRNAGRRGLRRHRVPRRVPPQGVRDGRPLGPGRDHERGRRAQPAHPRVAAARSTCRATIVVHYFPRDSFKTLAKQYFKYGRGRARTLLKLGKFPTLRPRAAVPDGLRRRRAARDPAAVAARAGRVRGVRARDGSPKPSASAASSVPAASRRSWRDLPGAARLARHRLRVGLVHYALSPDWDETLSPPRDAFVTTNGVTGHLRLGHELISLQTARGTSSHRGGTPIVHGARHLGVMSCLKNRRSPDARGDEVRVGHDVAHVLPARLDVHLVERGARRNAGREVDPVVLGRVRRDEPRGLRRRLELHVVYFGDCRRVDSTSVTVDRGEKTGAHVARVPLARRFLEESLEDLCAAPIGVGNRSFRRSWRTYFGPRPVRRHWASPPC